MVMKSPQGTKVPGKTQISSRENLYCHLRAEIAKNIIHLTLKEVQLGTVILTTSLKIYKKLDILCPGRFVFWIFRNWTFGKWTFCILDVFYTGRSVTGRLVTGCFVTGRSVTGRSVTGRFVGVPA
jgi:hypothetical protein